MLSNFAADVYRALQQGGRFQYYLITRRLVVGMTCNIFWVSQSLPDSITGTYTIKNHVDMFVSDSAPNRIGLKLSSDRTERTIIVSTDDPQGAANFIH